jgi:hypothetical protein
MTSSATTKRKTTVKKSIVNAVMQAAALGVITYKICF